MILGAAAASAWASEASSHWVPSAGMGAAFSRRRCSALQASAVGPRQARARGKGCLCASAGCTSLSSAARRVPPRVLQDLVVEAAEMRGEKERQEEGAGDRGADLPFQIMDRRAQARVGVGHLCRAFAVP